VETDAAAVAAALRQRTARAAFDIAARFRLAGRAERYT